MPNPAKHSVPSEWRVLSLGATASITGGGTPSKKNKDYWSGKIPWASPKDFGQVELRDTEDHVTEAGVEESSASLVPEGSILVVVRSGVLRHSLPVAITRRSMAINQDIKAFIPNGEVDSEYLLNLLIAEGERIRTRCMKIGTTVQSIGTKALTDYEVALPPLPEQKKIATILSSVDNAIAATRKVIEQTKRVKKGLLQDLMTRGIGHTRFKKTEIGEIPEEWEVVRLAKITEDGIQNGYSPKCPNEPTGRWILSLGALSPDGFRPSEKKPAPEDDEKVSEFFLRPGDFLVSRSNTSERVGWSALFRGEVEACGYPDLMMRFRVRQEKMLPAFMEAYLYSRPALNHLQARAAGTSGSMVKINQSVLKTLPVAIPPMEEQREIVDLLEGFRLAQDTMEQKEIRLKRLKRGLMQDLLTGRVRVPAD